MVLLPSLIGQRMSASGRIRAPACSQNEITAALPLAMLSTHHCPYRDAAEHANEWYSEMTGAGATVATLLACKLLCVVCVCGALSLSLVHECAAVHYIFTFFACSHCLKTLFCGGDCFNLLTVAMVIRVRVLGSS